MDLRPRLRRTVLALAAGLVLVACAGSGGPDADGHGGTPGGPDADVATREVVTERPLTALQGGEPLPEAELSVLGEDATVSTTSWRGTPTVVNFWATWCGFCVEEMPDLQAVSEDLAGEVRFVGVDREDRAEDALAFVRAAGVTYDLVEDPDGDYFFAVQGRGMPTTLFVDADGVIRHRVAGPLDEEALRDLVAEHLDVDAG